MSKSEKTKTFNIKKDSRAQAKKRKLEAFMKLVREDEAEPVPGKKKSTFQESYKALKDELKKYQKTKSDAIDPLFFLKDEGRCALVNFLSNGEISSCSLPLFSEDMQNLLLTGVLGNLAPFPLRWAKIENSQNIYKTVLIEIEGLRVQSMKKLHSELNKKANAFTIIAKLVSPNIPLVTDLCTMHLSSIKRDFSTLCPTDKPLIKTLENTSRYNFSKLHLLLSPIQLAMESYPLPKSVFEQSKTDEGYRFSKEMYTPVQDDSPMFAVDCEMCRTAYGNELTRVAMVNEDLETVYETLVKPKNKILDYLTRFSGITEKMLRNVTTTLEDVQNEFRKILPSDAILCGQSLNCDLHALKIIHPYIIDSSIIFNKTGVRHKKTKLKHLVKIHLNEDIQQGKSGHHPIEDAIASMKLIQLKLENSLEFGDAVLSSSDNESIKAAKEKAIISKIIKLNPDVQKNGFFSRISRFSKKVCLLGSEDSLKNYCQEMITDNVDKVAESMPRKILKAISNNVENYDLILSHLLFDPRNCTLMQLKNELEEVYSSLPKRTFIIIIMSGINERADTTFKHSLCMPAIKN